MSRAWERPHNKHRRPAGRMHRQRQGVGIEVYLLFPGRRACSAPRSLQPHAPSLRPNDCTGNLPHPCELPGSVPKRGTVWLQGTWRAPSARSQEEQEHPGACSVLLPVDSPGWSSGLVVHLRECADRGHPDRREYRGSCCSISGTQYERRCLRSAHSRGCATRTGETRRARLLDPDPCPCGTHG